LNNEIDKLKQRILELEGWKVAIEATLFNLVLLLKEMHDKVYEDHSHKNVDAKITSLPPRGMPGDRID
jgi:hypothetical protein